MKPHGSTGNKNASKPDSERKDAKVWLETTRATKSKWVKLANRQGMTLAAWIRSQLPE